MKRIDKLSHRFVEFVPEVLEEGILYVSMENATVIHKCCCGCGNEVVTPLSPTDWQLTFDGISITLYPSIGNWGFKCRSHYWIKSSTVQWAERWSRHEIAAGRAADRLAKNNYYYAGNASTIEDRSADLASGELKGALDQGVIRKLWRRLIRRKS